MWKNSLKLLAKSVALFLVSLGLATQAHATSVTLAPNNSLVSIGDTVNLDLTVSDVSDLYGFQFSLQFDPSLINLSGLTEGDALSSVGTTFFIPGTFDNLGGFLELTGDTLIGPITGFSGNGVLASLSFTAVGAGISGIAVNDLFLLDSSFSEIPSTINSASIRVQPASGQIPEPATIPLLFLALPLMVWVRRRQWHD